MPLIRHYNTQPTNGDRVILCMRMRENLNSNNKFLPVEGIFEPYCSGESKQNKPILLSLRSISRTLHLDIILLTIIVSMLTKQSRNILKYAY